ncbi:hypothetical protein QOZ80_5AG0399200 [Eleusine coracana subsp. coracana]|nr:hypothetical protein QOZ80_5AG0399200 [Eleusine coracana subsp. coracana]
MAAAVDQDSDLDSWVDIDPDNPADSSDDDAGVRSLSSGRTTPDCRSDDEHLGVVLALSSRRRSRSLSPIPDDDGPDDLFDIADAEVVPQHPPPRPQPLSGLFHHMLDATVSYASFDPIRSWSEKVLVPDPTFSACAEAVTVLASTRGLVCLRANASGNYIVANPATYERVRLPRHACDHRAYGDPAVVITFENAYTCCAEHGGHYHVVVAFPLGDGVYAYESFSSRTWEWTVAAGLDAVEQVVSASGVGALGRAFWRTTLGYLLCYNPAAGAAKLVPAPQEVLEWPYWELGCMDDTLCVTCMNERVNSVAVTRLQLETSEDGAAEVFNWSFCSYFEGGCLRNRHGVELLRSQGPEVVFWDLNLELVFAMDTEGRTTRTIGPLSGRQYYSDFIPYVSSSTGITSIKAGAECMITAADAEA